MSERTRRGTGAGDLAEVTFADDAERVEADWLLARELDPGAPAPSPKIASDYAQLEDLLDNLPPSALDDDWQDDVLKACAALASPSRAWWRRGGARWAMGGALAAAAAVVLLTLLPRTPAELEVAIHHAGLTRSDPSDVVVGDRLLVKARPRGTGDLRVYRADGVLVARCPNGPGCAKSSDGAHTLEVTLDAPVQYQVLLVIGMADAPISGTMESYMDAARAVNARIVTYPLIDVR